MLMTMIIMMMNQKYPQKDSRIVFRALRVVYAPSVGFSIVALRFNATTRRHALVHAFMAHDMVSEITSTVVDDEFMSNEVGALYVITRDTPTPEPIVTLPARVLGHVNENTKRFLT